MEFLKLCGTRPAHAYSICFNQSEEASGECSLYVINIFWAFLFRLFFVFTIIFPSVQRGVLVCFRPETQKTKTAFLFSGCS